MRKQGKGDQSSRVREVGKPQAWAWAEPQGPAQPSRKTKALCHRKSNLEPKVLSYAQNTETNRAMPQNLHGEVRL